MLLGPSGWAQQPTFGWRLSGERLIDLKAVSASPVGLQSSLEQRAFALCDQLSCRQGVKLGADRVHRGLDDGTNGWNCEHPIYELVEVRLDRGECLNDSFAGIWRQLVEQASQLIKFGGGFGDSRNSGLRGRFVLDA